MTLSWHDTTRMLESYGFIPKKRRGQTFLVDSRVAKSIVEAAKVTNKDHVLEIGGGVGALTEWLAPRAGRLTVIEIEPVLVQILRKRFGDHENVEIIKGDALTVPLPSVNKVVANLPYSISSEITFRLIREVEFEYAILMFQKEFADRLFAVLGTQTYSRLSIDVQYKMVVEKLLEVPASRFYPRPAVDSIVVRMKRRTEGPFAKDEQVFYWMVHGIYAYPNKILRKALRIWFKNMGAEKPLVETLIKTCGDVVDGSERLRALSMEVLVHLADCILELVEKKQLPDPRDDDK
ncbi:MAG: 16S rRNA (adenine(1518)-N(6)/adenine(1519)-N(6))-dimethyltransferase RsmA [Candidatus Thorarchaeota archaeon]|nr:16S rRNA (adenine(1518)-N(6)/adenine(1519)-N(6))-dimethyltransferase RsmA [Candidatus Thorarchaeota archaeon]